MHAVIYIVIMHAYNFRCREQNCFVRLLFDRQWQNNKVALRAALVCYDVAFSFC